MNLNRYYLSFLLTVLASSLMAHPKVDSTTAQRVKQIYTELKDIYAPDGRTAWFRLEEIGEDTYTLETTEVLGGQKMAERIRTESPGIKLSVKPLPEASLGDKTLALVNLSVANLRSTPKHSAELATQALMGTPLDVLKKSGGYYLVRTPEGYLAWLDAAGMTLKTKQEAQTWQKQDKLIITADYTHGFTMPDKQSQRVSDLVMGDILVRNGEQDAFFRVTYPDGRQGYVAKEMVKDYKGWLQGNAPTPDHIIAIAKTMLGVPYLWGGTSVKGVDCSGFTKTAFFMNGVVIPRDASQQVLVGEAIPILKDDALDEQLALKNLKSGDLLFFAGGKAQSSNARVTHVALYLGEGQFIHAAGTVRINSIIEGSPNYDDFQSRTIVAARRYYGLIGQPGIGAMRENPAYQ
ncbi:SH3 domain-containing protein [Dyadobacter jejuensis]|uniref:SH3 domain-containing protein n=1 Tax=Dyadobacter jejuensis TaxID=1082580 RepID=A0A316APR1_9BACT|nr:C40 family peptidase [Dyadobacter jejuensis]PWJ59471.1 SH3 domain-containing protein [Dyadobacter jejuensis]